MFSPWTQRAERASLLNEPHKGNTGSSLHRSRVESTNYNYLIGSSSLRCRCNCSLYGCQLFSYCTRNTQITDWQLVSPVIVEECVWSERVHNGCHKCLCLVLGYSLRLSWIRLRVLCLLSADDSRLAQLQSPLYCEHHSSAQSSSVEEGLAQCWITCNDRMTNHYISPNPKSQSAYLLNK